MQRKKFPIVKRLILVFFALLLTALMGNTTSRTLNAKGIFLGQPLFQLPIHEKVIPLSLDIIVPATATMALPICDIHSADFCIVDGNFIFERPVNPAFTRPFAGSYTFGQTDDRKRPPHRGVDFPANIGIPVLAAADGEVVFAGIEKNGAHGPQGYYYGIFIIIRHANDIYTLYAHLSKTLVEVGQQVHVGDEIGEVGQTGAAIGPHLHFEVRRGANGTDYSSTENPELWLKLGKDQNEVSFGILSISYDAGVTHKVQRDILIEYYPEGAVLPEIRIHTSTYPLGFENNLEDDVVGNLLPGRYRIAAYDDSGSHDRWVYVEAGRLTQVYIDLK